MEFSSRYDCYLYNTYGAGGFFHCVFKGTIVIRVLCIVSVGTRYEGSFLYISYRCYYGVCYSQALYSVRSPCDFQMVEIRVRDFHAMTPTEDCNGDEACAFSFRLFDANYTFDGATSDTVNGRTFRETSIAIFRVATGWFNCYFDRIRYLFFGTFAGTALTAISDKAGPSFQVLFRNFLVFFV